MNMRDKGGFTLTEILVAVSIFMLLAGVFVRPFSQFHSRIVLKTEIERVITLIDKARQDTLSSVNLSQYGVHIENGRVVLFKGATFTEPSADNEGVTLSDSTEIASISINGGGSDVVFKRLSGETNENGSFIVRLKNSISTGQTITVHKTGLIELSI